MDILVYSGLERLGDGVLKLPFVWALRQRWPEAHITWLAGKGETIYAHALKPLVGAALDEIIENARIGSHAYELLLRAPLFDRHFDLVIDTQRRVLTTLILRRIPADCFVSAAASFRLSQRRPARDHHRPPRLVDQLLDLIAIAGGRSVVPRFELRLGRPWTDAAARALPQGPVYIGVAPGAGGAAKQWPRERFIALAAEQQRAGREVVMILGPDERDWFTQLHAVLPRALFPLQDGRIDPEIAASPLFTLALGQRLSLAVANDSGVGHLLGAAGCPLVALFGPTSAAKFAPNTHRLAMVDAQRLGSTDMAAIPLATVIHAVERMLGLEEGQRAAK